MVKKYITISLFITSFVFSRNIYYNTLSHTAHKSGFKTYPMLFDKERDFFLFRTDIDTTVIWSESFDSESVPWLIGNGWLHSEQSYHSQARSMLSPNDNTTLADNGESDYYTLFSPKISLPNLVFNESMYFNFWLHVDMPDNNGDGDDYLDDYYKMDIQVPLDSPSWHISDYESYSGNSYWCGLEEIEGYMDGWLQFLDTPEISIPNGGASMQVQMKWEIEDTSGAAGTDVSEGVIDGWDAANVRISKDGGESWGILVGDDPYDFTSGYGWVYNGEKAGDPLASGWSGSQDWHLVSFDLDAYEGENVIIRFSFGSDPAYSTLDDGTINADPVPELLGVFIDEISITSSSGEALLSDTDAESEINDKMIPSGYLWLEDFHDSYGEYCFDDAGYPLSYNTQDVCEIANGTWNIRPGSNGWDPYIEISPEMARYGIDISLLEGKEIMIRFSSIYDDNHDGGAGEGLYLDDFSIFTAADIISKPVDFSAESINGGVQLSWYDMNLSGDSLFVFDNDANAEFSAIGLDLCTVNCLAYAGTPFPGWLGESLVSKIAIYNMDNVSGTEITINAYGVTDGNSLTVPIYTTDAVLDNAGWNEFDVNWQFEGLFVIAQSFTDEISVAFDNSVSTLGLWYLSGNEGWKLSTLDDQYILGVWGLRAYVSYYSGIDVTYNIYRDDVELASGLTVGLFIDQNVDYNLTYEYILDVVFDNGAVAKDTLSVILIPETVYELEPHDDGSFESQVVLNTKDFSAVRFTAGTNNEELAHFMWYQSENGGLFKIYIWKDNGGMPGDDIFSELKIAEYYSGWNSVGLSNDHITVSGDFWVGIEGKSSTKPIGVDTTSISGNSFTRSGEDGEWVPVEGNLAYRVSLDSNPLSISNSIVPIEFGINGIYPNPFNPIANIQYEIAELTQATLSIYDLKGRLVKMLIDDTLSPGYYTTIWNGTDRRGYQTSSGLYYAILQVEGRKIQASKLVFLK